MLHKNNKNLGMFYGISTFMMWGLFPAYFKMLESVNAFEILIHRIIWSVFFLLIIIKYKNKIRSLKKYLSMKHVVKTLFVSSVFIASNWGIYIYAVNTNRILDTSLGYLINPLFSMLLGAILLKEKLSLAAKISVFLVFIAIGIQIYSLGNLPLISVMLPASFAIYGFIKKRLAIPALEGLFIETMLLFPFALAYFIYLYATSKSGFAFNTTGLLLVTSGLITVLPLITFNMATHSLKLSTLGFLQYLSPTIGIFLAVFVYKENLDIYKIISFTIIWTSLLIVSIDGILRRKKQ